MIQLATTLAGLLMECDACGIKLSLANNGKLTIDAPQEALTPELLDQFRRHKDALLELLERYEERAATMEFDGGMTREEAERWAWLYCER